MFSQTAEYALRTMTWLSGQGGEPRRTQEIAAATQVPAGYLSKIMQMLVRAGFVTSQRGIGGGFTMTADPARVTPLDVINAVDPIERIDRCPLGLKSHEGKLCPMHDRLDRAIAEIEKVLGETSLAELVAAGTTATPFCE